MSTHRARIDADQLLPLPPTAGQPSLAEALSPDAALRATRQPITVTRWPPTINVVDLLDRAGLTSLVAWHGIALGHVEHHVDGWHPYCHERLDPSRIRHLGNRAVESKDRAVQAIVDAYSDPASDIALHPDGFMVRTSYWTAHGDEIFETVVLTRPTSIQGANPAWQAHVGDRPGQWLIAPSHDIVRSFEVWDGQPRRLRGLATNLYAAARIAAASTRQQP